MTGEVLGGWEGSGITSFNSGLSLTPTQVPDPFACTAPSDTNPANPADPLCGMATPAGTYPGGLGINSPNADIVARPDQVAPIQLIKKGVNWFSTNSFATAQGHFGSAGVGSFLGPGLEKVDLGLLKNFQFTERANLQLRAEAFNLFNHTNFVGPGGAGAGGIDTAIADTQFGQATSAHMPRTMQFSAKLYF